MGGKTHKNGAAAGVAGVCDSPEAPESLSFKFDCAASEPSWFTSPRRPEPRASDGAEQSRLIVGNGVLSMLIGRGLTSGRV